MVLIKDQPDRTTVVVSDQFRIDGRENCLGRDVHEAVLYFCGIDRE